MKHLFGIFAIIFAFVFPAVLSTVMVTSCTENTQARMFGGTMTVNLEKGQKLVEATWKGDDNSLWYLTEPMEEGYVPKTKTFQEDSRFGIMNGKVIFVESK